jgi:hypothetical protein
MNECTLLKDPPSVGARLNPQWHLLAQQPFLFFVPCRLILKSWKFSPSGLGTENVIQVWIFAQEFGNPGSFTFKVKVTFKKIQSILWPFMT